jgi:type IV secretion system protein VirB9
MRSFKASLRIFGWLTILFSCASVQAELVPGRGATDSRIRTVAFNPDQVYRIQGFVGFHIHLEFEKGETFIGLGGGDNDALGVDVDGSSIFLIPRAPRVATNLTIKTNKRLYYFDYSARLRPPDPRLDNVIYAVRFTYETDPRVAAMDPARIAEALTTPTAVQNRDYWYCGSPSLKPIAAFDDGVHTHLRFATHSEWPAIFVRREDGSESLANFSVVAGDLIVHRVAGRFVLRRGKVTGCIVNRGYAGGSARSESGTIHPEVERSVREVEP